MPGSGSGDEGIAWETLRAWGLRFAPPADWHRVMHGASAVIGGQEAGMNILKRGGAGFNDPPLVDSTWRCPGLKRA